MAKVITTNRDMLDHFSRVAASYNDIRTTDLEPILFITDKLNGLQKIEAADIGCGAGRYCLKLFRHLENLHLTCVDFNESMLKVASDCLRAAGITNFRTIKSLAESVPLADHSMDCIFSFNAIHHFDFVRFMDEMSRVLRDGGRIFIYTRLRSQNARNIWGRHFPLFLEKESRLYELWEMEEMTKLIDSLVVESIKKFKYWRNSTLSRLINQARNSHYSTFSLYRKDEFQAALRGFCENILNNFSSPDKVGWFDENILLVVRKSEG
ncbi:class I SAM-dependent methyltransferase [Dehalococcoidia bacterium]|nr:class I SAM-dependent methyltransferase [Dehalococcoidia bacterium]